MAVLAKNEVRLDDFLPEVYFSTVWLVFNGADRSQLVRMSMMQDYVFNIVRRSVCPSVDFVYGESYGSPYYSSLVYEW